MLQWMKVQWQWVPKVTITASKIKQKTLVLTHGVTSIVSVYHSLPVVWQTLVLSLVCLVTSAMVTNGYLPAYHT